MFFSPSRLAFINVRIENWTDLVEVEPGRYQEVSALLAAGTHHLGADPETGQPIAIENPPPETPVFTADQALQMQIQQMQFHFENATIINRGNLTTAEVEVMGSRIAELQLYVADQQNAVTPQLDLIWSSILEVNPDSTETKTSVAARLLAQYTAYRDVLARLSGVRDDAETRMRIQHATGDADAVFAVTWDFSAYLPQPEPIV